MITKVIKLANALDRRGLIEEADQLDELIKQADSQHNIIGLGYPKILAQILQEEFGKYSFLIARWLKEYHSYGRDKPDWLDSIGRSYQGRELKELLRLYSALQGGHDSYEIYLEENDYEASEFLDLEESGKIIIREIKDKFLKDIFFSTTMISDHTSGALTDLKPYKKLLFGEALHKHNQKKIFDNTKPIKIYENGYKWIDVGYKCELVGQLMSNCGSVGVMSTDEDRTMVALFDSDNKPHIVTTYSPNDKRISGVEGGASSSAKEEYHKYILDLIETLGVEYIVKGSPKSRLLHLKYQLRDFIQHIEEIPTEHSFDEYFKFIDNEGSIFYTEGFYILSKEDLDVAIEYITNSEEHMDIITTFAPRNKLKFENYLMYIFNWQRRERLPGEIDTNYISVFAFIETKSEK